MFALILKKIVILFALVDPIGLLPLYLAATAGATIANKQRFTNSVILTIFIAMLTCAVIGHELLSFFGVSMGSMQVGGGLIALMISFGMILGHQKEMKQTPEETKAATTMHIVPIAIPLLAGPAVLSFIMANSRWDSVDNSIASFLPIVVVCIMTWLVFFIGSKIQAYLRPEILSLIERLAGFLLCMLSIEMIVAGIKLLFPQLS